jgi:hypothetical protein
MSLYHYIYKSIKDDSQKLVSVMDERASGKSTTALHLVKELSKCDFVTDKPAKVLYIGKQNKRALVYMMGATYDYIIVDNAELILDEVALSNLKYMSARTKIILFSSYPEMDEVTKNILKISKLF